MSCEQLWFATEILFESYETFGAGETYLSSAMVSNVLKVLPSILLRSVFSRSGLSCASRLRSSLVQMMNALRGLLTLFSVDADLASGLVQLESEWTDMGLEGPELGQRVSIICSASPEPQSSLSNTELFAQSWKAAGSWLKRMADTRAWWWRWRRWCLFRLGCRPLSFSWWCTLTDICCTSTNRRPGGVDLRCEFQVFSRVGDRPIWRPQSETSRNSRWESVINHN